MSKYTLKTAKIASVEGLVLHGLTPNDALQLFQLHRASMEALFAKLGGRDMAEVSETDVSDIALTLIESAPAFVAHVIALAAHAPEDFDEIVTFPLGVQIEALERISELTFEGIAPKKFIGLVMGMFNRQTGPNALSH